MKSIILLTVLVAIAAAAPPPSEPVKIVRSDFQQTPDGGYGFGFETEDGVQRDETGTLKEVFDEEKKPHTVVVVRGSYKYSQPNGLFEFINYWADENGFHAEGDSIPKAPVRR